MAVTSEFSRSRQFHLLLAQPARTSPPCFCPRKSTTNLPSASAFRGTVPTFLLPSHLEHIAHAPGVKHMPEARHTKTPPPICGSFRIHDHVNLASTTNSFDPFVRRGFVAMRHHDVPDIWVSIFGCYARSDRKVFSATGIAGQLS